VGVAEKTDVFGLGKFGWENMDGPRELGLELFEELPRIGQSFFGDVVCVLLDKQLDFVRLKFWTEQAHGVDG